MVVKENGAWRDRAKTEAARPVLRTDARRESLKCRSHYLTISHAL
jgi:hypothetical protein